MGGLVFSRVGPTQAPMTLRDCAPNETGITFRVLPFKAGGAECCCCGILARIFGSLASGGGCAARCRNPMQCLSAVHQGVSDCCWISPLVSRSHQPKGLGNSKPLETHMVGVVCCLLRNPTDRLRDRWSVCGASRFVLHVTRLVLVSSSLDTSCSLVTVSRGRTALLRCRDVSECGTRGLRRPGRSDTGPSRTSAPAELRGRASGHRRWSGASTRR